MTASETSEKPLPANCPLCDSPIAADHGEHSGWFAHPASAECPLSLFAFPVEQLAAWNRRAPAGWRPIESAPITAAGDYAIEMLLTDGNFVSVGYRVEPDTEYDPRGEEEFIGQKGGWLAPRPTHWQPLPAPPGAPVPAPAAADAAVEALRAEVERLTAEAAAVRAAALEEAARAADADAARREAWRTEAENLRAPFAAATAAGGSTAATHIAAAIRALGAGGQPGQPLPAPPRAGGEP